jgi:hypothetical protein
MKPTIWTAMILLLLVFAVGVPVAAQRGLGRLPSAARRDGSDDKLDPNDPRRKLQKRMIRESFQEMRKESEQLVQLSTELRDMLQQTTEDELSLDVLKKAETIEKLAEKVKNRMKNL